MPKVLFDWSNIDWSLTDTMIAARLGCSRQRVQQQRLSKGIVTVTGLSGAAPKGTRFGSTASETARLNGVHPQKAVIWHSNAGKALSLGRPLKTRPKGFRPVMDINLSATARKYGVSGPTVVKWLKEGGWL